MLPLAVQKTPNDLLRLNLDLERVAKKLLVSAIAAAAVSGLVAASFLADSDGGDGFEPIGWLIPLLLVVGISLVIGAAIWAVRWRD